MESRPKINRNLVIGVCLLALVLLAAAGLLGIWSARQTRELVSRQFNQEQLVIARHVRDLIQRELELLRKELARLARTLSEGQTDRQTQHDRVQQSLARMQERGAWKIEILAPASGDVHVYMAGRHWSEIRDPAEFPGELPPAGETAEDRVWVSRPRPGAGAIQMLMTLPLGADAARLLLLHLNVAWLLRPFLADIRSGETGYAWVIDDAGAFLYHPISEFEGQNAFRVRQQKAPALSFAKIDFIQQEAMLKGQEGTGWYTSGWHRGLTGEIRKLIAYCPAAVSDHPPQTWSVAVVAPVDEVEGAVERGHRRQLVLQGFVILVILLGAAATLFFEVRWSRRLERKVRQRTAELRKSEDQYRSLVESAEDFIFTVNANGRFQSVNTFTANFFGGRPGDFIGKDLSALFPPQVAADRLELVKLVHRHGKSMRDEFEIEVEGRQTWLSANFMPLKSEGGDVTAVLCIARDITENKKLESQLVNTEKLASLGTLAAGVAHELNNPLGVILGFCDILLRKAAPQSQQSEDLKAIERQGLHCKQVVENLLSFARLGDRQSEHTPLNQCLEDILQVVRHSLEKNEIELVLRLRKHLPRVRGDFRQLQQVFLNLINNAMAAMPQGGTLTIRTDLERAARKAVIEFRDTGVGIPEEIIGRIFEPFFTTKPEGEGTGLGLFVSYGIITKNGGTIDCVSHDRGGPRKPARHHFQRQAAYRNGSRTVPGRILIVDDERDMLTVLQRFIQEETQHEVVTETDPLKALERFKADPFDLVVTDLKMPRMNGIALLEEIKAVGPDVSVIVMTAYGTIETAVEAIRRGAHDYITKPFRRERIIVSIDKAMKWREVVRENEALRQALAEKEGFSGLIGTTPVMKRIFERIRQVAPTTATVLIMGPSGTGKELLARAIHKYSLRSAQKLITLNCTAIPEQVIESELFGHVKGAFTGAWRDKRGLVEEAHEGTLFLDEIGDLSPQMQTKLLRLLQEGEYRPVGGITTKKADIRFVAATNHNLKEAIRERKPSGRISSTGSTWSSSNSRRSKRGGRTSRCSACISSTAMPAPTARTSATSPPRPCGPCSPRNMRATSGSWKTSSSGAWSSAEPRPWNPATSSWKPKRRPARRAKRRPSGLPSGRPRRGPSSGFTGTTCAPCSGKPGATSAGPRRWPASSGSTSTG